MAQIERPIFVVTLQPTADCTAPYRALRELLKRGLRHWGLRCIGLRYGGATANTEIVLDLEHQEDFRTRGMSAGISRQHWP